MLRLLLDNTEIDLYENESVNLTLQFSDVRDIAQSAGSFSQTFRVPATPSNLDFFGNIHEPSAVDVINVKEKIPAELVSGTMPLLRGFCQVKAIYIQKKKYADIELVFFGETIDLKSAVGDAKLSDLSLTAYNHVVSLTNIQNSWTSATGIAPQIRYALIDKGFNWNGFTNPPWEATDGLRLSELTPTISAYTIVSTIFEEAGFTFESDFLEDPDVSSNNFGKMYVPLYNGAQAPVSSVFAPTKAFVGIDPAEGNPCQPFGSTAYQLLPIVDDFNGCIDAGSNWDNTAHDYTAPFPGLYRVKVVLSYFVYSGSDFNFHIYKNGIFYEELIDINNGDNDVYSFQEYVRDIVLETGDTISFYFWTSEDDGSCTTVISGSTTNLLTSPTSFEIECLTRYEGQTIDIASNMPDMKQIDFLVGLQKIFNLVFVPDKVRPKHLIIEPFSDYVATGTQKDWTNLVDYDKDITIKPTTDLQRKQYQWTYAEGKDFVSKAVQDSAGRVYGRYLVEEPDNDFATGELTFETTFQNYLMSVIPGTTFPIHRSVTTEGGVVQKPLPMLAYYNGMVDQFGEWYVTENNVIYDSTLFPHFSNYDSSIPTIDDRDLNFGVEFPFIPIELNPIYTSYINYYGAYIKELYSTESRIMTCTLRLTRTEIANFEFSDNIFIKDAYWRVIKMSYDANIEGMVEVEMIKILSDVGLCDDTPTSYYNRFDVVLFNDSDISDPDFGSKACCEFYGYQWVKNQTGIPPASPTFVCRPKLQISSPE